MSVVVLNVFGWDIPQDVGVEIFNRALETNLLSARNLRRVCKFFHARLKYFLDVPSQNLDLTGIRCLWLSHFGHASCLLFPSLNDALQLDFYMGEARPLFPVTGYAAVLLQHIAQKLQPGEGGLLFLPKWARQNTAQHLVTVLGNSYQIRAYAPLHFSQKRLAQFLESCRGPFANSKNLLIFAGSTYTVGLNFQDVANRVFVWEERNEETLQQMVGRVLRPGQTRQVSLTRFVGAAKQNDPWPYQEFLKYQNDYLSFALRQITTQMLSVRMDTQKLYGTPYLADLLEIDLDKLDVFLKESAEFSYQYERAFISYGEDQKLENSECKNVSIREYEISPGFVKTWVQKNLHADARYNSPYLL